MLEEFTFIHSILVMEMLVLKKSEKIIIAGKTFNQKHSIHFEQLRHPQENTTDLYEISLMRKKKN
jgi:hypothetical protein